MSTRRRSRRSRACRCSSSTATSSASRRQSRDGRDRQGGRPASSRRLRLGAGRPRGDLPGALPRTMGATEFLNRGVLDRSGRCSAGRSGSSPTSGSSWRPSRRSRARTSLDKAVQDYPEALKNLFGISGIELTSGPGYLDSRDCSTSCCRCSRSCSRSARDRRRLRARRRPGVSSCCSPIGAAARRVLMKGIAAAVEIVVVSLVSFLAILGLGAVVDLDVGLERSPAQCRDGAARAPLAGGGRRRNAAGHRLRSLFLPGSRPSPPRQRPVLAGRLARAVPLFGLLVDRRVAAVHRRPVRPPRGRRGRVGDRAGRRCSF